MHCVASRFDYPNYRLSELSLVPISSDNRRSTVLSFLNVLIKVFRVYHAQGGTKRAGQTVHLGKKQSILRFDGKHLNETDPLQDLEVDEGVILI